MPDTGDVLPLAALTAQPACLTCCPPPLVQVADFLAAKLVQWDNRALWLELLYRHPQPGHPFAMQLPLRALVPPQGLPAGATIVDMLMATSGLSDPRLQVRDAAAEC